jgi:hypothetical protein
MKRHNERRAYKRCRFQTPVICTQFNSDRFYHARTTNHSQNGINFVTDFPLKIGASIFIRVDYYSQKYLQSGSCDCGRGRHIGLAEVKWCQEIPDPYRSSYKIGLKYQNPEL